MDLKAYIESGVLESYAMGMASAEEALQVERLCAEHPEVRLELEAIRRSLETYALAHSAKPSDAVKKRVTAAIRKEAKPKSNTIRPIPGNYRFAAIAASIMLVVSVGINVALYIRWNTAEDELSA